MSTHNKGASTHVDNGGAGGAVPPSPHAPTHAPQTGSDPLSTAAAGAIAVGDAAAVGVADSLARSDHRHSLPAPVLVETIYAGPGSLGTSPRVAREDHEHPIGITFPIPLAIGATSLVGTPLSFASSGHSHQIPAPGLPAAQVIGPGTAGVSTLFVREDHVHPMAALAPAAHASTHAPQTGTDPLATGTAGAIAIGDTATTGTADNLARSDHRHSLAAPALPAAQVVGAGTAGVATAPARGDHVHPMSAPAAVLPINFLDGLTHRMHSTTAIQIEVGSARDSTNTEDLVLAATVILDCATAGPAIQGRDQVAAFAANTMIAIYIIGGGGNPVATIASTVFPTFGSPTLPGTYSKFRWIGSLSITGIANNVRPYQQSGASRDRWIHYTDQTPAELTAIGTQGNSAASALAVVTTSTSWRNWVAGGTDVNFAPSRLIPPYPVAGTTPINLTAKGPLVEFHVTIGNDASRGFVEFAPSAGLLQAPAASPTNGSGIRAYQMNNSNSRTWIRFRVGEGQSFQYRNATLTPDYAIAVQGFMDSL